MKRRPTNIRKSIGVVLSMLVLLSYFSPMQQTLRSLPGRLTLTQGVYTFTQIQDQIVVSTQFCNFFY